MVKVSENIQLQKIRSSDSKSLFTLMKEVYPLAYAHFWTDYGDWYVNSQYAKENLLKELSESKAEYYFVLFKEKVVGNFRIIWDEKFTGLSSEKQVKLHRIYLHQSTQGNGIGKTILSWLEEKAKQKHYTVIWLDAMDAQPQAFQFYKKLGFKYLSHTLLPSELLHDEFRRMSQLYKKI